MKLVVEIEHGDLATVKPQITPLLEEIGSFKRATLPHCVQFQFEGDDLLAARVLQALGFHDWEFDGTVFRKKS